MPKPSFSNSWIALLPSLLACGPEPTRLATGTHERTMETEVDGQQLAYLLEVPESTSAPRDGWPLLLFLHGAGERGDDLARVRVHGPPKLVGEIDELRQCVLVAPQCPESAWWKPAPLMALLGEVRGLVDIDEARLYVTGLSMGGYGTWSLLAHSPQTFAAAVPICGGGDVRRLWDDIDGPAFAVSDLQRAAHVPIRAYHGEDDEVVPVKESRVLVQALEEADGKVELTVYPGTGHDSWTQTYADPQLYEWLFSQRRGQD